MAPPYYELKKAGHAVALSDRVVKNRVNFLCGFAGTYLPAPEALAAACGPRGAAVVALADSSKMDVAALVKGGVHVLAQNEAQFSRTPGTQAAREARPA